MHKQPCPCKVHMYLAVCHELSDHVRHLSMTPAASLPFPGPEECKHAVLLQDGSLVGLSNVVNVKGSGNKILPAGCAYLSQSPYAGSGTLGNVQCC